MQASYPLEDMMLAAAAAGAAAVSSADGGGRPDPPCPIDHDRVMDRLSISNFVPFAFEINTTSCAT